MVLETMKILRKQAMRFVPETSAHAVGVGAVDVEAK
jgi:hypothetical protein